MTTGKVTYLGERSRQRSGTEREGGRSEGPAVVLVIGPEPVMRWRHPAQRGAFAGGAP